MENTNTKTRNGSTEIGLTGDCILRVRTAYCAVSGCGGYCREK